MLEKENKIYMKIYKIIWKIYEIIVLYFGFNWIDIDVGWRWFW